MKSSLCEQEEKVRLACGTGEWPEALRSHAASCSVCRDVVEICEWMEQQVHDEPSHRLPDPAMIWWKAQLLQRQVLEQKAIQPVQTFQRTSMWVTLLALLVIIVWRWSDLERWVAAWTPGLERSWWALTNFSPVFTTLILLSASLIGISVLLTFFAVLSED